jgi:hypothetical protein
MGLGIPGILKQTEVSLVGRVVKGGPARGPEETRKGRYDIWTISKKRMSNVWGGVVQGQAKSKLPRGGEVNGWFLSNETRPARNTSNVRKRLSKVVVEKLATLLQERQS